MITAAELAAFDREMFPLDAWDEQRFTDELALPGAHVIDFRINGDLIGYVFVQAEGTTGHIHSIAIKAAYQRRHFAWELSRLGNRWLRDQGCTTLDCHVRTDNTASLKLCESGGFKIVETVAGYYSDGSDAYLLARELH